jgi:hypothetical protein
MIYSLCLCFVIATILMATAFMLFELELRDQRKFWVSGESNPVHFMQSPVSSSYFPITSFDAWFPVSIIVTRVQTLMNVTISSYFES